MKVEAAPALERATRMEPANDDEILETRLVQVRGQVQGIGYREACVRQAQAVGITGWVRNRMDGSVEVMLQGSPEQLDNMCAWLSEGMSAALVDELEVAELQPPFARFDRFERLPTL
ncbi:acylphosphatase [Paraburkholderia sp. WC7.3d]